MDLFSPNCPCCDSAEVRPHTRYTTQTNGTRTIHHCRSCDSYFSDTFAKAPVAEHPQTDSKIDNHQIHANPVEALNASLRRRNSAFRRKTNMYAKSRDNLQRTLDAQWLVHNFVRVH
jgi:hypothetical protein